MFIKPALYSIYAFLFVSRFDIAVSYDSGGIVEGCCENEVAFGCKEEGAIVVIKEAWIHDRWYKVQGRRCHIPEHKVQYKKSSVLQHINKKCAMQRACRFRTLTDVAGAKEEEENWKGHVLRVDYECIQEDSFYRTCGEKIEEQRGLLQNVGYPKYYLGPGACTYTLIVDPGQKIKLQIYDLSIREVVRPLESECRDYISVTEGSTELLSQCGNPKKPLSVTSSDHILNVTLHTSADVFLKRGFAIGFRAVGCPTPSVPEDGYLSYRNSTNAEFWCCIRHVFPDTMQRVKFLTCRYQLYWDKEVPDCVDLANLLASGNITEDEYLRYNGSASTYYFLTKKEVVLDIILPGVIMTVLILGNVGVLFLIIMCRRRIKEDNGSLEELESIKANAEPTDVTEPCQV